MKLTLLYLKTGGGHLSTAQSIADEFAEGYGKEVEAVMIDCLDQSSNTFRKFIEDGYSISTNQLPSLWKGIYAASSIKSVMSLETAGFSWMVKKHIREHILRDKPDKIVILHFLLVKPVLDILAKEKLKIPTIIITTDPFTPPRIWFVRKDAKFVVFSEKAKDSAVAKGIPAETIATFPLTINKKFAHPLPPGRIPSLKKKYGFSPHKKLILITGGGTGLPKGHLHLKALLKENKKAEFAVVTGKNKLLKKACEKIKKLHPHQHIAIYEFVDFMYELMNMADIVVTKGGPATVMETLMLEKPMVITSYIWAQEKGNVEFVIKNKVRYYETDPKKASKKAKLLLQNKRTIAQFQTNIKKVNIIKNGSKDIAKYIFDYKDFKEPEEAKLRTLINKIKSIYKLTV